MLKDIIEDYKNKGYEIKIIKENDLSILFNIIVIINDKKYIEDVEIIKTKVNDKDFLINNFNYLIDNALRRYSRGE